MTEYPIGRQSDLIGPQLDPIRHPACQLNQLRNRYRQAPTHPGYYLEPRTLPFTTALAMQRSPQFIGYTYRAPAGITLITVLCPIACQSITAGQAAVLVDNEWTARLLIMSACSNCDELTTTNTRASVI